MIDGLRRLASHLHNLDTGSGEAKLIWAAADEIEMLQRPALPPAGSITYRVIGLHGQMEHPSSWRWRVDGVDYPTEEAARAALK